MPFAMNQGARLHWRLQGAAAATPVVLLHSIGTDLTIYDRAAEILSDDLLVLKVDLRGHGASDATEGDYTLDLLAADVLAAMDAAGIDRAVICGTSLGGMVAMALVQLAPQRVSGLILANSSASMDPALWPERVATARSRGVAPILTGWAARHLSPDWMRAHPARVQSLERAFAAIDPRGYAGCAAAIRDMAILAGLGRVRVPALVIGGEHDTATPFAGHGDRIAETIPGARVTILPTGHLACLEQPALFADAVRSFATLAHKEIDR